MALSTATFTINNFPKGKDLHGNHLALLGTITVATGSYPSNGIPLSFIGHGVYEGIPPIDGYVHSPTTGINYQFDPVNQSLRIFTSATLPPGVTTAAFVPSANFGTAPTVALSGPSNQSAFSLTITAQASTGANPTIAYTFPAPYALPPVIVISRGNDADLTAGYWATEDAGTLATGATFEFVGTPTATKNYVLDAIIADVATNPSAAVVAGSFVATGWGVTPTVALENAGSTQTAFSLSVTAGATPAANPTLVLTFPVPFATAPIFVVSDGVARPTTGKWAFLSSTKTTATFAWVGTPTNGDVYILDAIAMTATAPAITTAAFAMSAGFGSTVVPTVIGNQGAFQLTLAVSGASIGANPTVTFTLPTPLSGPVIWVVSRGDTDSNTGYWAVEDPSTTGSTLVVKFVGTPVTGHTYALNAIAATPATGAAELAVGALIPAAVVSDLIYANVLTSYS